MKITICIGSSCHLKGSRMIVEDLQKLVKENNLGDKVELAGQFWLLVKMTAYYIVFGKAEKSDKFIRVFVIFP